MNESVFPLIELTKHEYAHYLQALYWKGANFQNSRFTKTGITRWFIEGSAEYLAGSEADGIRNRSSIRGLLLNTDPTEWLPLQQLLRANNESDFNFYKYGYVFTFQLAQAHPATFNRLIAALRNDSEDEWQRIVSEIETSSIYTIGYKKRLAELVEDASQVLKELNDLPQTDPRFRKCAVDLLDLSRQKDLLTSVTGAQFGCNLLHWSSGLASGGGKYLAGRVSCKADRVLSDDKFKQYVTELDANGFFGFKFYNSSGITTVKFQTSTTECQTN